MGSSSERKAMLIIDNKKVIYSFSRNNPKVAEARPGDQVQFITKDCFSNRITNEKDLFNPENMTNINPATGPLKIIGAESGDTLKVIIDDITVEEQGVMITVPGLGAYGHRLDSIETKIIPIHNGMAIFSEKIVLPIDPMIGVIGTSPCKDDIPCGTPGRHGGNMDTRLIRKGTTLYLPVYVPGAMLSLGDLHAAMGDGEVSICGIEISGIVTVTVDLIKGKGEPWPVLETVSSWYVIASDYDLDSAVELVLDAALDFLKSRISISINDLVSLLSIAGSLEICQIVDPLKTVRMGISKDIFKNYDLIF